MRNQAKLAQTWVYFDRFAAIQIFIVGGFVKIGLFLRDKFPIVVVDVFVESIPQRQSSCQCEDREKQQENDFQHFEILSTKSDFFFSFRRKVST